MTFINGNHLLVGDLIFQGGVGRVDMPGGDWQTLLASVTSHIFTRDDGIIYPGHGPMTDVKSEKEHNPFFR